MQVDDGSNGADGADGANDADGADAVTEASAVAAEAPPERARRLAGRTSAAFLADLRDTRPDLDAGQRAAAERLAGPTRHGYYLHGDVGRGKTMFVDRYLGSVPTDRTLRLHLHELLRTLHTAVWEAGHSLDEAVSRVLGGAEVLLIDDLHVDDLADATYVARVLAAALAADVLVLVTSNHAPDALLPDPGIHDRFRPTIERIEGALEVVDLDAGVDHRRVPGRHGRGFAAGRWRVVADQAAEPGPQAAGVPGVDLDLAGLPVHAAHVADRRVTVGFGELCGRPTGTHQYLALAERFDRLDLVAVPDFTRLDGEAAQRFTNLIDVLVDRDVETRIESIGLPDSLLAAEPAPRGVARTLSRLALLRIESRCDG